MLQIQDLNVKYTNSKSKALDSINFQADLGELVVIAGASGSGKSTLAQVLMNLIPSFIEAEVTGEILVDGLSLKSITRKEKMELFGFVPQYPSDYITSLLVEEEIVFPLENLQISELDIIKQLNHSLKLLDILHLSKRLTKELSSGELQRVALASALIVAPPILILDEPIARIDPRSELALVKILRNLADDGRLVIALEHRLDYLLEKADRVIILDKGEIIANGKPKEILNSLKSIDPPEISTILGSKNTSPNLSIDEFESDKLIRKLKKSEGFDIQKSSLEERKLQMNIDISKVRFSYTKKQNDIFSDLNFTAYSGQIIGLMGVNGSGKSTFFKLLTGINNPNVGTITIEENRIKRIRNAKNKAVLVPENAKLFLVGPTPLRDLERLIEDKERSKEVYLKYQLDHLMNKKLYHLSEGERRLCALVNAFLSEQRVLLIDEPTIGLDQKGRKVLFDLLRNAKEQEKTVIIASNDPRIFPYLDRVTIIENGRILLDGEPREILYELEEKTDLLPNQLIRLLSKISKNEGIKIPKFVSVEELNNFLEEK